MVVPTVLAIIARRNCGRCSACRNGLIVMSNVVILLPPWAHIRLGPRGMRFVPHPRKWMRVSMSVFLLVGAEPSLRARAHAGCGKPVLDSERHPPNAITGADIPNDTVLQINSVVLN